MVICRSTVAQGHLLWSLMSSHVTCTLEAAGASVKATSLTLQGGRHTTAVLDRCHKAEAGPDTKIAVPFAPFPHTDTYEIASKLMGAFHVAPQTVQSLLMLMLWHWDSCESS